VLNNFYLQYTDINAFAPISLLSQQNVIVWANFSYNSISGCMFLILVLNYREYCLLYISAPFSLILT